jgi:hypothetical protein
MARRDHYDENQLAQRLRLPIAEVRSARYAGAIPEPDINRWTWSRTVVDELKTRTKEIEAAAGGPMMSGHWAARYLEKRLGLEEGSVRVFQILRLVDRGLLHQLSASAEAGTIVAGQLVERAAEHPDIRRMLAEDAPLGPDQAAAHLGIRRSDWDHAVRAGWVTPAQWAEVRFGTSKAGAVTVPLYRTADVDAVVTDHPEVDWAVVRATPKGRRSLLAKVPAAAQG